MLISKTYQSPSQCERLLGELHAKGLFSRSGTLQSVYLHPSRYFQSDIHLVLHYDPFNQVDGIALLGKGAYIFDSLRTRYGHLYGLVQIFVHRGSRRQGVGRALMGRLIEGISVKHNLLVSERAVACVARDHARRVTHLVARTDLQISDWPSEAIEHYTRNKSDPALQSLQV